MIGVLVTLILSIPMVVLIFSIGMGVFMAIASMLGRNWKSPGAPVTLGERAAPAVAAVVGVPIAFAAFMQMSFVVFGHNNELGAFVAIVIGVAAIYFGTYLAARATRGVVWRKPAIFAYVPTMAYLLVVVGLWSQLLKKA